MSDAWYESVPPQTPLTQGDMVMDCPLVGWRADAAAGEDLSVAIQPIVADVIVMTQACDLLWDKVPNVVLCPHIPLEHYRVAWAAEMRRRGHNPTEKAWRVHCDDITEGYLWNLCMLNGGRAGPRELTSRVVDFHEVFTVPRVVLESLVAGRSETRPRLLPPYREHLSQAFARFFMRVGLPQDVSRPWRAE